MAQDGVQLKAKILSFVKTNGPSLPVHLANQTGLSILFASAFLSELISDRELKTSNMRVGSSPLYLIPGQEPMLENYSQHLKNKEKEAYLLLKERRFLKDKDLEPAIRVALRAIKDFAIAFEKNSEIHWRYLTVPESEFQSNEVQSPSRQEVISEIAQVAEVIETVEVIQKPTNQPAEEVIIENVEIKPESSQEVISDKHSKKKTAVKKPKKSNKEKDKRNNFFNKVKEILTQKGIEILDITEISINKIIFKVKKEEEYLIIAYNKKKVSEADIINSHKKSQELGLPYKIMIFGEPLKRFGNLIEAVKNLKDIEKIE